MKIFGVSVVKDEDDILLEGYTRFLKWCDYIAVVDNGSSDKTTQILQELQDQHKGRFFFLGVRDEPFSDSLRRYPYDFLKGMAGKGDWWCRLDPDEEYVDNPRRLLKEIPFYHSVVASIHIQYYFTKADWQNWDDECAKAAGLPYSRRRRFYKVDGFSEQRFWRHYPGQTWHPNGSFPKHIGAIASKYIRIKHFKYRSPEQIQKRIDSHTQANLGGHQNWAHDNVSDWKEKLADETELSFDQHDGNFVCPENMNFLARESLPRSVAKSIFHLLVSHTAGLREAKPLRNGK